GECGRLAWVGRCGGNGAGRAGRTVPSTVSATRADPAAQRALEARTGVRLVKLRAREAFERNGSMGLSETGGTARTMRPRGRGPSFDAGPVIDKVRTPLARTRPVVVVSPAGLHLPCDVARLPLLPFGYIGDVTWPTTSIGATTAPADRAANTRKSFLRRTVWRTARSGAPPPIPSSGRKPWRRSTASTSSGSRRAATRCGSICSGTGPT